MLQCLVVFACCLSCSFSESPSEPARVRKNPLHPVTWGDSVLEDVQFEGLLCRKGTSRGLQILQIEPAGRNLTLVAYDGTVDLERLARELVDR